MKNSLLAIVIAASAALAGNVSQVRLMPLNPEFVEELRAKGELDSVLDVWKSFNQNNILASSPLPAEPIKSGGAIAILVDFDDNKADTTHHPPARYDTLLFSVGKWKTGSMKDFYIENSYDQFYVSGKIAPPPSSGKKWYRLEESYSYWSENYGFSHSGELVLASVQAADSDIDFSQFDNDGPDGIANSGDDDGVVDAVFIIHAGPGYEEGHCGKIWSHASGTYFETNDNAKNGGKIRIERYSIQPEEKCSGDLINMGVFSHEYGHILGIPDLYDYDYDAQGAGRWTLMASGSWNGNGAAPAHFDAWSKLQLGWVQPENILTYKNKAIIPAAEFTPTVYRLWTDGDTTSKQYFLIENRQKLGLFDAGLPGEGLIIYHVDDYKWSNDEQYIPGEGSSYQHYHVAVEQADGLFQLERNANQGDVGDPYPGTTNRREFAGFFPYPTSRDYTEEDSKVAVLSISDNDSVMYANLDVGHHLPYFKLESIRAENSAGNRIEPGEEGFVYLTVTNVWSQGSDVEAELVIDNDFITLNKSKVSLGSFEEGETKSSISNPFTLILSDAAPTYLPVEASLIIRELSTGTEQKLEVSLTFGWPGVLLVNDSDEDNLSESYDKTLNELGVPHEFVPPADIDIISSLLLVPDGNRDSILIWFTGKKAETLDEYEVSLIDSFLESGGKLILSSENLGGEQNSSEFFTNVLHADLVKDTQEEVILTGTPGNPLFGIEDQVAVLPVYTVSKDALSARDGAQEILSYSDSTAGALIIDNDTSKIVYLAFPLEGIGGNPAILLQQKDLLYRFLTWFGYKIGIEEAPQLKSINNSLALLTPAIVKGISAKLDIFLSLTDMVKLNLYDSRGCRVASHRLGLLETGSHRIEIPLSGLPSGVYFITLETSKDIHTKRMVILK